MKKLLKPLGSTRRSVLASGCLTAWALASSSRRALCAPPAPASRTAQDRSRADLLAPDAPGGLEIIQLTSDPAVPSCHVYMEAQIFTPDSKRFILHRSAHPHGSDRADPKHQYLLCDIEDNCALHPLTDELGTTGPAVSPDGKYLYYFVDSTASAGPLILKRVNLDGTDRKTIVAIDGPLPGTNFRPTRVYPLSTISSDGSKVAISACLNHTVSPLEYGLLIFDVQRACVEVVLHGPTWVNMHPQFCRSTDPQLSRDILLQENHGTLLDTNRQKMPSSDTAGLDIHVIRDDGTKLHDLPWGRDGIEFCEGHQCWRGRSGWAITSVGISSQATLIEGQPVSGGGHLGAKTPGGVRNQLLSRFTNPQFHHFATDLAGTRLITDYQKTTQETRIYVARLGECGRKPLAELQCIARPRPSGQHNSHVHPFLSPDGRMAFFNSDESGIPQAYLIRGLPA